MRLARLALVLLQALFFCFLNSSASLRDASAAVGNENKIVRDWLVVPVFYATNRNFHGDQDNFIYSEEPNEKGLSFGVKNIITVVPENSPVRKEIRAKMFWQHIRLGQKPQDGPPPFDKAKCGIKDSLLSRDEIVPAFTAYMKNTGNSECVIFVHGCCTNYDTSMDRAAKIAAHMQVPVLLYDWVSPRGFSKYLENETRVEQTIDDFCKFIAATGKVIDPENISLIGHSMGAQFLDKALVRRAAQIAENKNIPQFKELIMSNADVDAKSFLNHSHEFASNAKRTRVYFSQNDDRLKTSAFAHGGFSRLGMPGSLIKELADSKTADFIDITANDTGHELPFWVFANLHRSNDLSPVTDFHLKELSPNLFLLVRDDNAQKESMAIPANCICN